MDSVETNKAADQPFSTEVSFRYLFTEDFKKAETLAFDLIDQLSFPHLNKVNEDKASILASWEFALALDALPSNAAKVKAVRKLLGRLGKEFIEETRWTGPGRYDGEVLDNIAIGMARVYSSLPPDDQKRVWGNQRESQGYFAVLTRTIQLNTRANERGSLLRRFGLQRLLLGLIEQNPTILDDDFDNPVKGPGEGKYVNPSFTVFELVESEYNSNPDIWYVSCRGVTPLTLGHVDYALVNLAHQASQKAYERGLEGVLNSH